MKKTILLLVGIALVGCKEESTRPVYKKGLTPKEAEYPKVFTYHRDDIEQYTDAIVLASDGHEYWIHNKSSDEKMEHYWNCKTCKK